MLNERNRKYTIRKKARSTWIFIVEKVKLPYKKYNTFQLYTQWDTETIFWSLSLVFVCVCVGILYIAIPYMNDMKHNVSKMRMHNIHLVDCAVHMYNAINTIFSLYLGVRSYLWIVWSKPMFTIFIIFFFFPQKKMFFFCCV